MDNLLLFIMEKLHITPQNYAVSKAFRNELHKHKSMVIWFTGLSGSGKSTLANKIEIALFNLNISTYILDGDNTRNGLNKDLTFTDTHRQENIRRVAEVSKILVDAGIIVLATFISPFQKDREMAKELIGINNFIDIYVYCPLEVCEERDVKGLYKKARNGEITNFTGISSPFEPPLNPSIIVNTATHSLNDCCQTIIDFLLPKIKLHE